MSILYVGLMLPLSKETPFIVSAYSIFYMMRYMLIAALLFYGLICSIVSVGRFSPFRVGLKTPISVNLKSPMHHVCY